MIYTTGVLPWIFIVLGGIGAVTVLLSLIVKGVERLTQTRFYRRVPLWIYDLSENLVLGYGLVTLVAGAIGWGAQWWVHNAYLMKAQAGTLLTRLQTGRIRGTDRLAQEQLENSADLGLERAYNNMWVAIVGAVVVSFVLILAGAMLLPSLGRSRALGFFVLAGGCCLATYALQLMEYELTSFLVVLKTLALVCAVWAFVTGVYRFIRPLYFSR